MKLHVGLLLGLTALGLGSRAPPPTAVPAPHTEAASASAQILECRLHVGQELAFHLHGVTDSIAAATAQHLDLSAVLHWRVLATRDAGWLVAAALDALTLERKPEAATAQERAAFAEPFLVELGRDCRFKGLGFAPRSNARVQRQLEALLRSLEIVLPVAPVRLWTLRQDDAMGSYQGHYELETAGPHEQPDSQAKDLIVSRRRVRYFAFRLPSAGPMLGGPTAKIVASRARATLDSAGAWLTALSSHDQLQISLGEQLLAEVSGSVELERSDSPPLSTLRGLASDRFVFRSALQAEEGPPEPKFPDASLLAMNLQGALANFQQRLLTGRGGLHDGVSTLAGYLAQKPGAISELMARLRSRAQREAIDPKLHSVLFLALERTGTPEAERALASALGDQRSSEVDRMRAAAALADVPRPSRWAVEALLTQTRTGSWNDVSRSALLALGTLDRNASTSNPELAGQARQALGARLRAGPPTDELITDIDAVGNSGHASLIQAIERYSTDPSPQVRAHTAEAYARANGPADEAQLIAWFARESEPGVRRAIVGSLSERVNRGPGELSSELLSTAISALAQEPDAQVRGQLIRLLGAVASSEKTAKQALIAQFHRERRPELLGLIGHYCSVKDLSLSQR